ncbi:MAG: nucleotidyltransferase family protein [bacterium]|nr:nucleotidyltransferase family protein [bacterium]
MLKTRDYIFETIERNKEAIRKFGVKRLGLFGSFARGDQKETSDLDFLVEFEHKTFDAYMDLKLFLEDLFNCRIDLVTTSAIRPELRAEILEEAVYVPQL